MYFFFFHLYWIIIALQCCESCVLFIHFPSVVRSCKTTVNITTVTLTESTDPIQISPVLDGRVYFIMNIKKNFLVSQKLQR